MFSAQKISKFCEKFLETEKFSDYCKNGLQISGKKPVKKIALGVSSSKIFLEKAAQWGADMCIAHHGIIFGKVSEIDDVLHGRLKILLENDMSLAGFHLPLDAHPEVGNNAVICKKMGLKNLVPTNVGFTGDLEISEGFSEFLARIEKLMGQKAAFSENFGPKKVSRVSVISGGASGYSSLVLSEGADTFIFGELKESAFHELQERGINFIAAGHFATERFGVQALGKKIEEYFPGVETKFFDQECFV